jgi:hypothetical protein
MGQLPLFPEAPLPSRTYLTISFYQAKEQYATVLSFDAEEASALEAFKQDLRARDIRVLYEGSEHAAAEQVRGEVKTLGALVDRLSDEQVRTILQGAVFDILMSAREK